MLLLLVFVRYFEIEDKPIKEDLLLSKVLETTSKGFNVMQIISHYFDFHDLKWEKLVAFCTHFCSLGSRNVSKRKILLIKILHTASFTVKR